MRVQRFLVASAFADVSLINRRSSRREGRALIDFSDLLVVWVYNFLVARVFIMTISLQTDDPSEMRSMKPCTSD